MSRFQMSAPLGRPALAPAISLLLVLCAHHHFTFSQATVGAVGATRQSAPSTFDQLREKREAAVLAVAKSVEDALSVESWCPSAETCNSTPCLHHACNGKFSNSTYVCKEPAYARLPCEYDRLKNPVSHASVCKDADGAGANAQLNGSLVDRENAYFSTDVGTLASVGDGAPILVADNRTRLDLCALKAVRDTIATEYANSEMRAWLYASTTNKAFVSIPGTAYCRHKESGTNFKDCGFDPTVRSWYVPAASGPRDVVFLFDATSLTGSNSLLRFALKEAISRFDTRDHLAVLSFTQDAVTDVITGSVPTDLRNGSAAEWASLTNETGSIVDKIPSAAGSPNITRALAAAFNLLADAVPPKTSNCAKFVVLMTGRRDICYEACRGEKTCTCVRDLQAFLDGQQERLGGKPAFILTFTESKSDDPLERSDLELLSRSIVCSRNASGIWHRVTESDSKLTAMDTFYQLSALQVYGETPKVFSSEIYSDFTGLGLVFTFSVPIYDRDEQLLVGVAGADVLLEEVTDAVGGNQSLAEDKIRVLSQQSRACVERNITNRCAFQNLRSQEGSAQCAERLPTGYDCYEFGNEWLMPSNDSVTFSAAKVRCEDRNGTLVVIKAQEKNRFVSGLADVDGSWIGLRAPKDEDLQWVSEPGNVSEWELFFSYDDDKVELVIDDVHGGSTGACVTADSRGATGNWNVVSCSKEKHPFICQFNLPTVAERDEICPSRFTKDNMASLDAVNPDGCLNEKYRARRICTTKQEEDLKEANPLCKQFGNDFDEADRHCCNGRADSTYVRQESDEPVPTEEPKRDVENRVGLGTGIIAGIAVGSLLLFLLAVLLIWLIARRWKREPPKIGAAAAEANETHDENIDSEAATSATHATSITGGIDFKDRAKIAIDNTVGPSPPMTAGYTTRSSLDDPRVP